MIETKTLRKIIEEAHEFECCPDCGNVEIESHYCPKCKERISTPYDAEWFAEYLSKKYEYKLKGNISGSEPYRERNE